MNKTYIKRQITLHKLGLPINDQVKDYYDYFHSLIGNINDLGELILEDDPDSIFWRKKGKVILEYNKEQGYFWIDYNTIWKKFEEKYQFNYDAISELFGGLLGEAFNLKVTTTHITMLAPRI